MRPVSLQEIETHLSSLGSGNHEDNLRRLKRFDNFYLVSLTEAEFFGLVFLQNSEIAAIAPPASDRALLAVAKRAVTTNRRLSSNWDIPEILRRSRAALAGSSRNLLRLPPLVLCEARDGEERYGVWYLQDGSHRALGLAALLLLGETTYVSQSAYCGTSYTVACGPTAG